MNKEEAKQIMYEKCQEYQDARNQFKKACRNNAAETYIGQYIKANHDSMYMHVLSADASKYPMTLKGHTVTIEKDYINYCMNCEIFLFESDDFDIETNQFTSISIITEEEYLAAFDMAAESIKNIKID